MSNTQLAALISDRALEVEGYIHEIEVRTACEMTERAQTARDAAKRTLGWLKRNIEELEKQL